MHNHGPYLVGGPIFMSNPFFYGEKPMSFSQTTVKMCVPRGVFDLLKTLPVLSNASLSQLVELTQSLDGTIFI